jgi:Mg-chelatase subunit ChlD
MASRVFLLDRSGSMDICRADTIEGYNTFVDAQKEHGGTMTLILFDHEINVVYENTPIADVKPLDEETFVPRGGTALLDAIGHVLKMDLPEKTTVVVLTDGDENSSIEYTSAHIKDLIQVREKTDGWSFVYLGANQDTITNAKNLGIRTSVGFDTQRTPDLFRALSAGLEPGHSMV